jgi:hypothetical protein
MHFCEPNLTRQNATRTYRCRQLARTQSKERDMDRVSG